MKPLTFIFSSHEGDRVVSFYYQDSLCILLEIFRFTFEVDEDIHAQFYLNEKVGKLDLGEFPFNSSCLEDCTLCTYTERHNCFSRIFEHFIFEVSVKLQEVSKERIFEEFVAGRVTYRVV